MTEAMTAEEWANITEDPNQPFGFTREDVKTLYYVARTLQFHTNLLDERLLNLSDRIEALLPPKSKETPQKGG